MRVRDTWLLEDFHSFDEPTDWSVIPEFRPDPRREAPEDDWIFRALLEAPEDCWAEVES